MFEKTKIISEYTYYSRDFPLCISISFENKVTQSKNLIFDIERMTFYKVRQQLDQLIFRAHNIINKLVMHRPRPINVPLFSFDI